jgi:hypothetical protein
MDIDRIGTRHRATSTAYRCTPQQPGESASLIRLAPPIVASDLPTELDAWILGPIANIRDSDLALKWYQIELIEHE